MIERYADKWQYLYDRQGGLCAITGYPLDVESADLHHRCNNSAWRRDRYPRFIDSVLNLELVDHAAHLAHGRHGQISDHRAGLYEAFLARHPRLSAMVNCEKQFINFCSMD